MNKHSTNKQSFYRKLLISNSLGAFIVRLFLAVFVVFLMLFIVGTILTIIRLDSFKNAINDISTPNSWKLISQSSKPSGPLYICLNPDISCEGVAKTYSTSVTNDVSKQLLDISDSMTRKGYRVNHKCLDNTCGNEVIKYHIQLRKGQTTVGISVEEHDSQELIYIGASRN